MITITKEQFNQLNRIMDRCFNFIVALEDMDIPQVKDLQATPKEYNISMIGLQREVFLYITYHFSLILRCSLVI